MNFTIKQIKAQRLYKRLIVVEEAFRLTSYNEKLKALRNAVQWFERANQPLSEVDIVTAARKLWNPRSRVSGFTYYYKSTSSCKAVADGLAQAMGCSSVEVASWCSKWPMTKTASENIQRHCKECWDKLLK